MKPYMPLREPTFPISSAALAQLKHWLDQPPAAAQPELLLCDRPSWIETWDTQIVDGQSAIIFRIKAKSGKVSEPITIDPSGFAVLRLLTAFGAACMVDHRKKGGKPYVKVF